MDTNSLEYKIELAYQANMSAIDNQLAALKKKKTSLEVDVEFSKSSLDKISKGAKTIKSQTGNNRITVDNATAELLQKNLSKAQAEIDKTTQQVLNAERRKYSAMETYTRKKEKILREYYTVEEVKAKADERIALDAEKRKENATKQRISENKSDAKALYNQLSKLENESASDNAKLLKKQEAAYKEYVNSILALEKKKASGASEEEIQLAKTRLASATGSLGASKRAINKQAANLNVPVAGSADLTNMNAQMSKQLLEDSKQITAEYTKQATYKRQVYLEEQKTKIALQEQQNQYNQILAITRQISENQKRIATLEKNPDAHEQELIILRAQTAEMEEQKTELMSAAKLSEEYKNNITQIEKKTSQNVDRIKAQNADLQNQNKTLDTSNDALADFGSKVKNFIQFGLALAAVHQLQMALRETYQIVVELDKAFTDIQMVTGGSSSEIMALSEEYNTLAKQMGATTSEVASGATEWLRQGKTVEETGMLLKSSMTLSTVSAMESSEATELLTSTLNGYKLEAEDAIGVIDKVTAVDMAAATSAEELMTALSRTANSADDAGVSFDKLLSMIATTSSVTRKSASTIGESFKTIFARMSNVAAGKDIDDEGEALNDVETSLNKVGIALRESEDEWRNFEDVLDEVAEKWTEFTSTEQSQVATAIAGTRQQENFRALMNNWSDVENMMGVTADSAGSATERLDIYLESVTAKTDQLTAAWEGFVMSLNSSEALTNILDLLIQFVEKLEYVDWGLVGVVAALGALITIIPSVVAGINTVVAAIAAGGVAAGISTGGISILIGLLVTLAATVGVAFASVQKNLDAQLDAIEDSKQALEEEKASVESLYEEYSELEAKSKYYGLTADEKQRLVDVSSQLVTEYGLESDGINTLTGQYNLANDALSKYIENLEREKLLLSDEETKVLTKGAKESISEINKKTDKKDYIQQQYGIRFLTGDDEEQKEILGLISEYQSIMGKVYQTAEERIRVEDLYNELSSKGYGNGELYSPGAAKALQHSTISEFNEIFNQLEIDIAKNAGKLTEEQMSKVISTIELEYLGVQSEIISETENLSNSVTKIINSKLGQEVPMEVSSMISKSMRTAFQNDAVLEQVDGDVDKFIEDYTNGFVNIVNASGEELEASLSQFTALQEKAVAGDLTSGQYGDYQNALRVYIELQRQAYLSTGMTEEQVEGLLSVMNSDIVNNLNVQLLEMQENMAENSSYTEEQVANFTDFTNVINDLNSSFKNGEVSVEDYFSKLDNHLSSIDITNIEELKSTFGDLNNFVASLALVLQDTTNYIDSIFTAFRGGGDSLEFFNKFLPAAETTYDTLKKIRDLDSQTSEFDLEENKYSNYQQNAAKVLEANGRYGSNNMPEEVQVQEPSLFSTEKNQNLFSGRDLKKDVEEIKDLSGEVISVQDIINDNGEKINLFPLDSSEVEDGINNIDDAINNLGEDIEALSNLDLNIVDSAFENVIAEFDKLPDGMTNALSTASDEAKDSSKIMAQSMIDAAKSTEDYSGTAIAHIREVMGIGAEESFDIAKVSSDVLAEAYLTDAKNAASFATDMNSIAQQAMGEAIKSLGIALDEMGSALANLNVKIPIRLDGLRAEVFEQEMQVLPNIKTELTIGGEGTTGLSGIGSALSNFGKSLQNENFINSVVSNFTPVQSNYMPETSSGSSGSGYSPSSEDDSGGSSGTSDAEKLAEDIAAFREDEGSEYNDVTEELINQYNAQKDKLQLQKESLEYAEGLLDAEEDTTKWLKLQNEQLKNQKDQIEEIYRSNSKIEQQKAKIQSENSKYNISAWMDEEGNATLEYANLLNDFIKQEKEYRQSVSITTEEDLANAEKYIAKLQEEQAYVENLFNSVSQLTSAWNENSDALEELFTEMNDNLKEMRDTLLDKFMESLERQVDETNQVYEDNISKIESLISLQEKYYSIVNDAERTKDELEKELQTNKDTYQYLDDDMRELIFNEDDYKVLSAELDKLIKDMGDTQVSYQEEINALTEDEMYKIEEITAEYERQMDLKQKEYDIAKAELDLAKAQTELENAKNERTVRMLVNGQWQWVASPEAVKSASENVADVEAELNRLEEEKRQQELIDTMEREADDNQLNIDLNNQLLEKIEQQVDDIINETKSMESWLEEIAKTGVPGLHDVISGVSKNLTTLIDELGANSNLVSGASQNTTDKIKQGLLNGSLNPDEWAHLVGWIQGDNGKWYSPMDDPYYDPAGFDFGTAKPESQTSTDSSGVQTQTGGSGTATDNSNTQTTSSFPRQGSLKNVISSLNIRSGAGMDYGVIGKIPPSGKPQIVGENGNWAQLSYNGITGWSSKDYLTYDKGGLMYGKGVALKDVIAPEAVLSPEQTKAWVNLVDNLTSPVLANLIKTPTLENNRKEDKTIQKGDTYSFNNVTVKANDIQEFISSMKGLVPIRNN